ncbi:hypothetical protein [Kordiimonas gwangyangensis]|uniref:hypothetical protein n=1 Tax=Kordiimonas gwangyangensis TaxID=288022 RepID=UPI000368B6AF|nr:hypothetical protein [Kordiimonas gwangyangensis]
MNVYFFGAALLAAAGTAIHVVAGRMKFEAIILDAPGLNARVKTILHACWHAVSILLAMIGAGFLWAAFDQNVLLLGMAATVVGAGMGMCTAYMVVRHKQRPMDFWPWSLFWLMAVLGAVGTAAA